MVINDIREWIKATFVSHKEFCGYDAPKNSSTFGFSYNMNEQKSMQWHYMHRPKIVCVDGFEVSIQGGVGNYSTPKDFANEYEDMEIGFPSNFDDPEFADNDGQVCGYIPVDDLQKVITRHGGIDVKKSGILELNYSNAKKYKRELKLERILK